MGVYLIFIVYLFSFKEKKKKKKWIEKKGNTKRKEKQRKIKKIRVDPLIHWIDCLLYEKKNDILK